MKQTVLFLLAAGVITALLWTWPVLLVYAIVFAVITGAHRK